MSSLCMCGLMGRSRGKTSLLISCRAENNGYTGAPCSWLGGKNGEKGRKFGMVTYTQLCLKWRTNEDLLLSTGNSAQSHVQPGWERSLGRTHLCTCMAESLGCPPETTTTLFIGYTPEPNEKFTLRKRKRRSCPCCALYHPCARVCTP